MKTPVLSILSMAAVLLVACGPSEAEIAAQKAQATADSLAAEASKEVTYTIDASSSALNWVGNMTGVKVYSHSGDMKLMSGSFTTKGPLLQGGEFVVDMSSINPTDDGYSEEHPREGLIGHLSTPDFFDVANHPTASLKVLSVEGNTAQAELTLRGKTNTETISDIVITLGEGGAVKATGKMTLDRQKYGVAFPGPAADLIISNDIELSVELAGQAM